MKSKKIIVLLTVLNIVLIGNSINTNKSIIFETEKQVIKEMIQSENETNLQTQIDNLNTAQEEYALSVQAYKKQIADAITSQGVSTSENDTGAVMAENIGKIIQTKANYVDVTLYNSTSGSGTRYSADYSVQTSTSCTYTFSGGIKGIKFLSGTVPTCTINGVETTLSTELISVDSSSTVVLSFNSSASGTKVSTASASCVLRCIFDGSKKSVAVSASGSGKGTRNDADYSVNTTLSEYVEFSLGICNIESKNSATFTTTKDGTNCSLPLLNADGISVLRVNKSSSASSTKSSSTANSFEAYFY